MKVSLKEVYTAVAQRADTPKQKIDVSIVSRVLASFADELLLHDAAQVTQIISSMLDKATKRDQSK